MSWSLFRGLLPIWSTTAFWIPAKPLYLRIILSQSTRLTENCNTYRLALMSRKGPILHNSTCLHFIQPMLQKLNKLGYEVCLIRHIHLTSPQPPLLQASQQLFARKMLTQPARCRKCFPRVHWILKHRFLCYRNKQTYFSLAKLS